jgi:hypothetical protein
VPSRSCWKKFSNSKKPRVPPETAGLDYLLFRPWYPRRLAHVSAQSMTLACGAETVHTAAAEVAYWLWRFLQDTSGLTWLQPLHFYRLSGAGEDLLHRFTPAAVRCPRGGMEPPHRLFWNPGRRQRGQGSGNRRGLVKVGARPRPLPSILHCSFDASRIRCKEAGQRDSDVGTGCVRGGGIMDAAGGRDVLVWDGGLGAA